jgi:hypothetical protein
MIEKRFKAVSPQSLTVDGNIYGLISVINTKLFKVKQIVMLQNSSGNAVQLEIKRIESTTNMYVGPIGGSIDKRYDTSIFTVASGAFVFAEEQMRPKIPEQEVERNTYEEEPVVARRVVLVDALGEKIDDDNPLPIDGTISVALDSAKVPTIINVTALTATEYVVVLPQPTKKFLIRTRNHSSFKISYTSGATNINFISIGMGCLYNEEGLQLLNPLPVYVRPNKPNEIIEVLYWQ